MSREHDLYVLILSNKLCYHPEVTLFEDLIMKLPNQAQPVLHAVSAMSVSQGVSASGMACTICKLACDALAPTPKALCLAACASTVC